MNRLIIFAVVLTMVACTSTKETASAVVETVTTTLDRTKAPTPGPAPEIKIGDYQYFQLDNGLKVYVVENHKLPRVAFSLRIDRDPIVEGDKAAYTSIAGNLLGRGTTTKSKAEIDEAVDFVGASFNTSSTGMFGAALTKHKDALLGIMEDVLMNPSFPQADLDKLKKIETTAIINAKDDPSAIVNNIRGVVVYGKEHPYGEMASEQTVANVTRQDIVNYYEKYWSPKSAYLAIVGDITLADAKKVAAEYFGDWKGADLPEHKYEVPTAPANNSVVLVDRPQSVQSEIRVTYPVELNIGDKDFFAATLMNKILGSGFSSRLNQNLREDHGYTYGAGSGILTSSVVGRFTAGTSVRNEVTDSSVHEILFELDRIADGGVTAEELKSAKAGLTGAFSRSLEEPTTVAGFALNTAINELPQDYYANYLKQLDAVTLEEVNAAAKKFIKPENAHIVVVGKASEIADKLKRFGDIIYYDADGNTYDPAEMNKAAAGMKPTSVVGNYLNAIGGAKALSAVQSVKKEWELDFGGQKLKVVEVKTQSGQFRQDIMMGPQIIQQVISDGKDVAMIAQGQKVPMSDEEKAAEILKNRLFPELHLEKSGAKMKIDGVVKVEGKDAYNLRVIFPTGDETNIYFDIASGLKVKETSSLETPMGPTTQSTIYGDYKAVNNIQIAHKENTAMGPQKFSSVLKSIEFNPKVGADYFTIK